MKKLIVLSLALALVLTMTSLAFAAPAGGGETTLRITISPRAGPTGTAITVTGTGAHPDKPVKVSFVVSGEDWGPPLATTDVTPNADGTFEVTVTAPGETADGTYAVRASQTNPLTGNIFHYWWNSFVVGAAPAMPPTGGEMPQSAQGTAIIGLVLLAWLLGASLGQLARD
ncbi:MAG: hypothetical protein E3J21_11600 [Anaerolineales bacterium]|nr:MAG: hypothetical protein E3J21_11600 [Anaerolineales bacterium]